MADLVDASVELAAAAIAALKSALPVQALVADRVYDRAPQRLSAADIIGRPYVTLGPSSAIPADFDCLDGEEIVLQFDVWSGGAGEAFGTAECRKICNAIKRSLHYAELALATNALVSLTWELTRIIDDPDPAIRHGVVQFTATVETPPAS